MAFRAGLRILLKPWFLFTLAVVVLLDQYEHWGKWFELSDLHHETFIIALVFAGLVVLFWTRRLF